MLRCDRNPAERGSILWYSEALEMDLRLCMHHSKLHAAGPTGLEAKGFERLTMAEEVKA